MAIRTQPILVFLLLVNMLVSPSLYGQSGPSKYSLHQLDNRYGLSNSAVNCILQDSDGMLWVGTWDGLNRYDGQEFHVFNFPGSPDNPGLVSNIILGMAEDRHQRIWISTVEGISRYDKRTNAFKHYFYGSSGKRSVSENGFGIVSDTSGQIFARTPLHGLVRYDVEQDTFVQVPLNGLTQPLSALRIDTNNRIWVLSGNGQVATYRISVDGFQPVSQPLAPLPAINGLHIAGGTIFCSDASGTLYRYDGTGSLPEAVIRTGGRISAITEYGGRYYVAMAHQGLQVYDASFNRQPLPLGMHPLADMKIRGWAEGEDRLLWVATDGNGFVRVSPYDNPFRMLLPYTASSRPPVRAITDVGGDLWVGTKGGGISIVSGFVPQQGESSAWRNTLSKQLTSQDVFTIVRSQQQNLVYIGTDGTGLSIVDRDQGRLYNWHQLEGYANFPAFGSVYAILEDVDGSLWVGTSGYGLLHLRVSRLPNGLLQVTFIRQYRYLDQESGLANDIVYALCLGMQNQLLIACRYGGLSLLDKANGQITNFKAFSYEGSLTHNDVLSLYRDNRDRLWVGTSYGLNWIPLADISQEQPAFQQLTASDGLPNNTIHAITSDESGNIWVSTNRGLARIDPSNRLTSRFLENDGLQAAEFSDGAVWKDALGHLYFGGISGISYFHPQHIPQDVHLPNLVIEQLRVGNAIAVEHRYTVLRPNAGLPGKFVLPRSANHFAAKVHALSYLYADRCEYAWMLEGHDNTWQYHRSGGQLGYTNIPPGAYRLLLKWSNGSGLWTDPTTVMAIRIKPYWWQSWPATTAFALLLLGMAYWWYKNRKNKLNIQHRLQLEQSLREKDEALHESQLGFFTNIAHELQTPLTVVMGVTEQLEAVQADTGAPAVKSRPLMGLLKQQASRLTYLVQQLLEFRKAQGGHLAATYQHHDVSALLNRISEVFLPVSAQQENTFELHIPDDMRFAIDQDKIEKIVFNLLSNAFRHSGRHEHIMVTAKQLADPDVLHIQVANSGCLLAPDETDRIFEKFHSGRSGDAGTYSTGIGLAFSRELVGVLGGTVAAAIEDGWITFDVHIPIPATYGTSLSSRHDTSPAPDYSEMAKPATNSLYSADYNKVALLEKLTEAHKKSVLVVEDEQDIRYLIREVLRPYYIIYEAADGLEAINVIKQHPPDLIISDVMMPGMDGLMLCEKVKNTPATCHIPIVILSAKGTLEQHNEGYEVGADAYIAKPFQGSHLLVRVKNLLDQRERLHKRLQRADSVEDVVRSGNQEEEGFLRALVSPIMSRLDDPDLNAGVLEDALSLSKMQLYRKLKTVSGMTPSEFIRHIRLKQATQLLAQTDLTVNEIFYQTGFNNQSYFFREFKKHYGCSPNEYRSRLNLNT